MAIKRKCFACDRVLGSNPFLADCVDEQTVFVGSECYRKIKAAGVDGWQPPKGGPRLFILPPGLTQEQLADRHRRANV